MKTWQVTLLTAGMTFIGGLLLGRQTEKREERQRKAQRTQVYADKAIKVLSKTKVTLAELRPEGLIAESELGQSRQRVHDAINEYMDAKQPLIEVAFGHPRKEVRDALSQVD